MVYNIPQYLHNPHVFLVSFCDVTTESLNSGARVRRLLLSNGSEITFSLKHIAANESLPGKKLLNTRFPRQQTG
jgi:hypothetical protein